MRYLFIIIGAVLLPQVAAGQGLLGRLQPVNNRPNPDKGAQPVPPVEHVSAPMEPVQILPKPKVQIADAVALPPLVVAESVINAEPGDAGWTLVVIRKTAVDGKLKYLVYVRKDARLEKAPSKESPHYLQYKAQRPSKDRPDDGWTLWLMSGARFTSTPNADAMLQAGELIPVKEVDTSKLLGE